MTAWSPSTMAGMASSGGAGRPDCTAGRRRRVGQNSLAPTAAARHNHSHRAGTDPGPPAMTLFRHTLCLLTATALPVAAQEPSGGSRPPLAGDKLPLTGLPPAKVRP